MELLIIMDSFKRASAARITAVLPYYGYARQDRKDQGRVPITAKLVANLLSSAGAHRVLALDLHAAQIQGFFDIPVDHLHAAPVINDYVRSLNIPLRDFIVLSPDEGSIKRAWCTRRSWAARSRSLTNAFERDRDQASEPHRRPRWTAEWRVIFDDMITTAGSVVGAANVAKHNGAARSTPVPRNAVLCGRPSSVCATPPLRQIIVTDSIPLPPHKQLPQIKVLSVAPLLADAIKRIHFNES